MTNSPVITETSKERNRRLLLRALREHMTIAATTSSEVWDCWTIPSRSDAGAMHIVMRWEDGPVLHEDCDCDWAQIERQRTGRLASEGYVLHFNPGTLQASSVGLPCAHILLARLDRHIGPDNQPDAELAAALALDKEFARALRVSQYLSRKIVQGAAGDAWRRVAA